MAAPLWSNTTQTPLDCPPKRCTLQEIESSLPYVRRCVRASLYLSSKIKNLIEELHDNKHLPLCDDFDAAPRGACANTVDALSSLKVMLSEIHDIMARLLSRGCFIDNFEEGVVFWYSDEPVNNVKYFWRVNEASVRLWSHASEALEAARPLTELPTLTHSTES